MKFSEEQFLEDKEWQVLFEEEPGLLIEYLERNYRNHLAVELPALVKEIESHCSNKSLNYPQLQETLVHLKLINATFQKHLLEEAELFALLKKSQKVETTIPDKRFLKQLIRHMDQEHTIVIEGFNRIRSLCVNYQLPIHDAVLPAIYARLRKGELLMLKQILLESKLLFEKFIRKMETSSGSG